MHTLLEQRHRNCITQLSLKQENLDATPAINITEEGTASSSECRCQNLKANNGSLKIQNFRMESNWDFQAGFPWFDEGRIIDSLGVA